MIIPEGLWWVCSFCVANATQCLFYHFQVRFVHGCVRVSADNNIIHNYAVDEIRVDPSSV